MQGMNDDDVSKNDNVIHFDRDKAMSDVLYAQDLLRHGFPEHRYGSVKALIYAAHVFVSRKVNKEFTQRRARSIWEGTARRIDSEEMDALRVAVLMEERREQQELRARLAALDARLAVLDEAFHEPTLAALRQQARRQGE